MFIFLLRYFSQECLQRVVWKTLFNMSYTILASLLLKEELPKISSLGLNYPATKPFVNNINKEPKHLKQGQCRVCVPSHSAVSDCSRPHGLETTRLFLPWDSLGQNLEWVAISFSGGIFPIQGPNPCLLHWQENSLPLSQLKSPLGHSSYIINFLWIN